MLIVTDRSDHDALGAAFPVAPSFAFYEPNFAEIIAQQEDPARFAKEQFHVSWYESDPIELAQRAHEAWMMNRPWFCRW